MIIKIINILFNPTRQEKRLNLSKYNNVTIFFLYFQFKFYEWAGYIYYKEQNKKKKTNISLIFICIYIFSRIEKIHYKSKNKEPSIKDKKMIRKICTLFLQELSATLSWPHPVQERVNPFAAQILTFVLSARVFL